MDAARLTIMAIVAIGFFYVILPVTADVYFRFRRRRTVTCPETGRPAEVQIDAWHAAATAIPGPPGEHVTACTRWPEHAECAQGCVANSEAR